MPINTAYIKKLISESDGNNVPLILGKPGSGICQTIVDMTENDGNKAFVIDCSMLVDMRAPESSFTTLAVIPKLTPTIDTAAIYAENNPDKQAVLVMGELDKSHPNAVGTCVKTAVTRSFNCAELPENLKIVLMGYYDVTFPSDMPDAFINRLNVYRP